MRIRSFTVSGLAGFRTPLEFGPLADVNVLRGPNNAGKSGLLRAIELYMRLLGACESVSKTQREMIDRPDEDLITCLGGWLNEPEPPAIRFDVEWHLSVQDLEGVGLAPESPCDHVRTTLELKSTNRTLELQTLRWDMNKVDAAVLDRAREGPAVTFAQQVRRLLSDARPFQFERPVLPVAWPGQADGIPQALRDALFDARQSRRPEQRERWRLFASLAASLEPEIGAGAWDTTFDRTTGKADLIYVREDAALAPEDMGRGAQRYAALIGELVLAQEPWICLEEPECRLSPELQKRFMGIARRVLQSGVGPRQIFASSHSPFIAREGAAFSLHRENGEAVLRREAGSSGGDRDGPAGTEDSGLGGLIGLVETLAELAPEELLAGHGVAGD